ncbi:uncharacterized protein LOC126374884 [Pectinophora gossypiella]|uniref:uncharacterized protein LOC126374884 n=1 Tax=Pectinophora gossypiella TaxID=13191 RepID=UPI00214E3A18|nr:uncharacterized protein LOC126374884 [Pectinophora gossypiella]
MPCDRNVETQQAISREIKNIQSRCVEAINIVENAPPEMSIAPENVTGKSLCYVEGLRTELQNSNTVISTDDNLLTAQFLCDIKEKTNQMQEVAAFLKGAIYDVDAEINRLNEQIRISQEARARPLPQKQCVQPQHMQKAKERFQLFKSELHSLIHFLFPDKAVPMKELMAHLMAQQLKDESSGYIPITTENYCLIELLRERNIVTVNPYNNMEVKLAL